MAAGIFTANTTIKISAAVAQNATATSVYTCPANSYAILNAAVTTATNAGTITVGGQAVITFSASALFPNPTASAGAVQCTLYVGPGQTVAVTGTSNVIRVAGVEFINSP